MPAEEMFHVREDGDLRLITPSFGAAVANAPWTKETLPYRSRIETLDGETVSQGFKKFFNLGSGPTELQVRVGDVASACERGDAVATLKLDGSLLIRSVHHREVLLRTRGAWGYEHQENAHEIEMFREKYPNLFLPQNYSNISLLFEWTTPTNTIVLKYPEPSLTLIGGVDHRDLSYLTMRDLEKVATSLRIPLVEHFKLDTDGWYRLLEKLKTTQDVEGYVIRLRNEQVLVKVKADPYLTKHALKSQLTSEKLADMYFQWDRPTYQDFITSFTGAFDEETCMWALPAISSLYDGVKQFVAITSHMQEIARGPLKDVPRKEAAEFGLKAYGQTKRFSLFMNYWEGRPPKEELLKSILLQNTKQVEMGMFSKGEEE